MLLGNQGNDRVFGADPDCLVFVTGEQWTAFVIKQPFELKGSRIKGYHASMEVEVDISAA